MFCACEMNDAACVALIFLPVCALTSLMKAPSVAHVLVVLGLDADPPERGLVRSG